jgi:hypothetical protein
MGGKPLATPQGAAQQQGAPSGYTSQDFNASTEGAGLVGGIKGPQTIQQATDENAIYQARAQARIVRETEEHRQAIEAERQRRVDAGLQRLNQAAAEYEQKSKLTSYKEDHGLFHNILSAFAVGLGAYGGAITHSPNYALEILNKEMDQDMERKKLAMESAFNKYKQAGLYPQQLEEWAKQQHANLLATQQAQIATVEKMGAKALAPFPQAQQAFLQATAERKAKQAKDALDFMKEATAHTTEGHTTEEGAKRVTVNSTKGGEANTATDAAVAKANQEAAKRVLDLIKGTAPEDLDKLAKGAERAEIKSERIKGQMAKGEAGQTLGEIRQDYIGSPEGRYSAAENPEQAELLSESRKVSQNIVRMTRKRASEEEVVKGARNMDPMEPGIPNEERVRRATENKKLADAAAAGQGTGIAKIENRLAATAAQPAAPKGKAGQQRALMALPAADRAWATKAMTMKKGDPGYDKAQRWLSAKGIR